MLMKQSVMENLKTSFEFYMDDEHIKDYDTKFRLVQQHLQQREDITESINAYLFGFSVNGEYLFIRRKNKLEYLKIFDHESLYEPDLEKVYMPKSNDQAT